jgi:hypothetical protein
MRPERKECGSMKACRGGSVSQKIEAANPARSAKLSGLTLGNLSCFVESAVSKPAVYTGLSWTPSPR